MIIFFGNNIKVCTVPFDQFNASLLNYFMKKSDHNLLNSV